MAVQLEVIENDRRTNLSSEELNENQITDKLELRRLVRLKTFYNIINDPPALCFVITLIVLVLCCPFLALYIKQANNLPDFDTMKIWNSFLGKLPQKEFCLSGTYNVSSWSSQPCERDGSHCKTIGVILQFLLRQELIKNNSTKMLAGDLTGQQLRTKIRDQISNMRLDRNVTIHIHVVVPKNNKVDSCSSDGWCTVDACVLISAPSTSKHFNSLYDTSLTSRPCEKCLCTKHDVSYDTIKTNNVYMLQLAGKTKCQRVFKPANEKYKRHGLIVIYLQQSDQERAASNLYKTSIAIIALLAAFIIGMSCTDRHHN